MEAVLKVAMNLHPQSPLLLADYACFLIFEKGDVAGAMKLLRSAQDQSRLTGQAAYCLAMGEYLEWAFDVIQGKRKVPASAIAERNQISIEDAFVQAASSDGTAPIIDAMLRTKTITNINTIGSGNYRNRPGCCPAIVNAAAFGNLVTLRTLVRSGANVNAEGDTGRSALIYALYSADPDMAEFLLKQGANVNKRSVDGVTPIYLAAYLPDKYREKMLKLLLKYHADPSVQTPNRLRLPILLGIGAGTRPGRTGEVMKILVTDGHLSVNYKDDEGSHILAASMNDPELVRFLLSRGSSAWGTVRGVDLVEYYEKQPSRSAAVVESLKLVKDARSQSKNKN